MNKPKDFLLLVDAFKSFPAIGQKNAIKYAYHILNCDEFFIKEFLNRINNAKKNLRYCQMCHNLCFGNELCDICSSNRREKTLCIVDSIEGLDKIEESQIFNGYYHVLHGELNPKKNISEKNLYINDLISHLKKYQIKDILIATSLSIPGEMTCEYIRNLLINEDVNIYRIGFGIPNNSSINYSDDQTLKFALINKRKIK